MKEERMAVLSMVEKGIITVDEAERLEHRAGHDYCGRKCRTRHDFPAVVVHAFASRNGGHRGRAYQQ